jgi:hypothetical protein
MHAYIDVLSPLQLDNQAIQHLHRLTIPLFSIVQPLYIAELMWRAGSATYEGRYNLASSLSQAHLMHQWESRYLCRTIHSASVKLLQVPSQEIRHVIVLLLLRHSRLEWTPIPPTFDRWIRPAVQKQLHVL